MKKLLKNIKSRAGAVSMEYVLVIAAVVIVLILALSFFASRMTNVIDNQGEAIEGTAYESYCKAKGKSYSGSLGADGKPICR